MKKAIIYLIMLMGICFTIKAQNIKVEVPIKATGGTIKDTLDEYAPYDTIVTLELSSDDAEQENDEVDTPYDDDLDAGWEGDDGDANVLTMGLRFRDITIPQGATIDSAFVYMYSHEGKSSLDVANITIVGEATDSAHTFDSANFNSGYLLTDRTETSASVDWIVAEDWTIWTQYRTPDLKTIIQEIVDRSGWKYGNPLALILKGEDQGPSDYENAREFEAFENIADPGDEDTQGNPGDGQNHPERVPKIVIYYSLQATSIEVPIKATGGTIKDTLDEYAPYDTIVTLELSSDDAEQENDEVDTPYDDDLDAGWEGDDGDANVLTMGLRFRDITIPQGATIDSAFVYMYSHEGKSSLDVANITIVGEATDSAHTFDSANFNSGYLLTDRTETSASVDWIVAEDWTIWTQYRTPDLKTIIQEIVDRSGWKYGNPLALILKGEDQGPSDYENAREFEAFENIADPGDEDTQGNPGDGQNHPERVPKLKVYYHVGGSTGIINTYKQTDEFKLYPNPVKNGIITIELTSIQEDTPSVVYFYDLNGKTCKTVIVENNNDSNIDVNELTTGFYIVKLVQGNNVYTQKIIIQ